MKLIKQFDETDCGGMLCEAGKAILVVIFFVAIKGCF